MGKRLGGKEGRKDYVVGFGRIRENDQGEWDCKE